MWINICYQNRPIKDIKREMIEISYCYLNAYINHKTICIYINVFMYPFEIQIEHKN